MKFQGPLMYSLYSSSAASSPESCTYTMSSGAMSVCSRACLESEVGLLEARIVDKFGRASAKGKGAVFEHVGAVGDVEGLNHVLLHQQHGDALGIDPLDH